MMEGAFTLEDLHDAMDEMERDGLLRRYRDDRGRVWLELTPRGAEEQAKLKPQN
jgi:DNA-binding MarR family transcriptional regulator